MKPNYDALDGLSLDELQAMRDRAVEDEPAGIESAERQSAGIAELSRRIAAARRERLALTGFLLARLDEDTAAVRAEPRAADTHPHVVGIWLNNACYLVAQPARLLAEVAAKRVLLVGHEPTIHRCDGGDFTTYDEDCGIKTALASVYADHPDYDQEWMPGWMP